MLSGSEPFSPFPTSPSRPRDKDRFSPTTCSPPFPSAAQVTPNHASSSSHGSVGAPPSSSVLQPAVRIHEVGPPVAKYRSESAASSDAGTEQAAGTRAMAATTSQPGAGRLLSPSMMVMTPVGRGWRPRFPPTQEGGSRLGPGPGATDQPGPGAHSGILQRSRRGGRAWPPDCQAWLGVAVVSRKPEHEPEA